MIQQTIYVPVKTDKDTSHYIHTLGLVMIPIPVEKQENKIVLDKEELRSIISEAQGAAFAWGIELCSFESGKEQSETYISNLLKSYNL